MGWDLAIVEPPADAVLLNAVGARLSLEPIYEAIVEPRPA